MDSRVASPICTASLEAQIGLGKIHLGKENSSLQEREGVNSVSVNYAIRFSGPVTALNARRVWLASEPALRHVNSPQL